MNEQKAKKWQIITLILMAVDMALLLVLIYFDMNDLYQAIAIGLLFILLIPNQIINNKLKKLNHQKTVITKEEIINKLSTFDDSLSELMYQMVTNQIDELNEAMIKYNLEFDFDYNDEDNYVEIIINSIDFTANKYYAAINNDNFLYLSNEEEASIFEKTNDEIIEMLINDIEEYHQKK